MLEICKHLKLSKVETPKPGWYQCVACRSLFDAQLWQIGPEPAKDKAAA